MPCIRSETSMMTFRASPIPCRKSDILSKVTVAADSTMLPKSCARSRNARVRKRSGAYFVGTLDSSRIASASRLPMRSQSESVRILSSANIAVVVLSKSCMRVMKSASTSRFRFPIFHSFPSSSHPFVSWFRGCPPRPPNGDTCCRMIPGIATGSLDKPNCRS